MVHAFQHNHVYYMFYFVKKHHVGKNVKKKYLNLIRQSENKIYFTITDQRT